MSDNDRVTETETVASTGRNDGLPRRTFVKSLVVAGTTAAAGGVVGTVAADEYETIEAKNQTIEIDSGEIWEHKVIDLTTGNDVIVIAQGTDWTIRNIGFHGRNTSGAGTATFGVADTGGDTSTIEHVYLGDGSDDRNASNTGHGQTAVWVHPDHDGHIDMERLNVQDFADNAIYASAPGTGGGGTIHIDSCFAANCHVSHYRLATDGSAVTNSCAYVDGSGNAGRGVWAWAPGPIEVDGCHLAMNGGNYAIECGANGTGATVAVSDTEYDTGFHGGISEIDGSTIDFDDVGTDPDPFIPDGVPRSAEAAAIGEAETEE